MTPEETEIRRKLRDNFPHYASRCLNIRTKAGKVERLELNAAQLLIHERIEAQRTETGKVRAIILKGRQQGCSTYVEGRFYWRVTHRSGVRAFILTHEAEATNNLFDMAVRYHENCPDPVKPSTGAANAKELIFDKLDSGYKVGTAGTKGVGRSSTIQYFHGCLSPDTFIVTETGDLRRMGDYQVGDLVRTHTGAIAPVSFISLQQKPAFRVTIKGLSQMPLVATAEHRFLTPGGWRELGEISPGDHLLFPVPGIVTGDVVWPFRLPDKVRPQGGGTRETGPDEVAPSYELGRVLGLYLAEGCIAKQSKTGEPSAVTFAVHEREVARTEAWLQSIAHLFRSSRTSPRATSKTVTVTVYGRSFATFVRSLCGELDGKRMPANWHRCGPDFARGMVHGYLSGDGCSSKREYDRRISAPSIRPAITVGMRDALAALGYGWACIAYHPGRLRYGKAARPAWTLRLSGAGVDRLCDELGWSMPPRRRHGAYGEVRVEACHLNSPHQGALTASTDTPGRGVKSPAGRTRAGTARNTPAIKMSRHLLPVVRPPPHSGGGLHASHTTRAPLTGFRCSSLPSTSTSVPSPSHLSMSRRAAPGSAPVTLTIRSRIDLFPLLLREGENGCSGLPETPASIRSSTARSAALPTLAGAFGVHTSTDWT